MNKLYRYILVGIFALIPCFSNAGLVITDTTNIDGSYSAGYNYDNNGDIICVILNSCNTYQWNGFMVSVADANGNGYAPGALTLNFVHEGNWNSLDVPKGMGYCTQSAWIKVYTAAGLSCSFTFNTYTVQEYTSLQCQTEYSLIPVSDVTENYCKLNFDLIDPADCPLNEGTGTIVRSNLTINNTPYAQNQNINVYIPDFLAWNVAFNDFNTTIEVEGYNADEDYINNVIDQEKLTPTNEDFTNMILALTGFIPYLFIALLFFWIVRIINRIWR